VVLVDLLSAIQQLLPSRPTVTLLNKGVRQPPPRQFSRCVLFSQPSGSLQSKKHEDAISVAFEAIITEVDNNSQADISKIE